MTHLFKRNKYESSKFTKCSEFSSDIEYFYVFLYNCYLIYTEQCEHMNVCPRNIALHMFYYSFHSYKLPDIDLSGSKYKNMQSS